jgi:hypothetical protein
MSNQEVTSGESGSVSMGPKREPVVGYLAKVVASLSREEDEGDGTVIHSEKILFAFSPGAAGRGDVPDSARIYAKWIAGLSFDRDVIYIRTADGIYRSLHTTLAEFKSSCGVQLEYANRSVLVNPWQVRDFDALGRIKRLEFAAKPGDWSWRLESVKVGRVYVERFRELFGMKKKPPTSA